MPRRYPSKSPVTAVEGKMLFSSSEFLGYQSSEWDLGGNGYHALIRNKVRLYDGVYSIQQLQNTTLLTLDSGQLEARGEVCGPSGKTNLRWHSGNSMPTVTLER